MQEKPLNSKGNTEVYRTTVWSAGAGCHGGCGQKLYVKDGKLVKVEGDENHPWNQGRACPRVLALKQYMYHPDRIIYPLKLSGKRGEGRFERISWDEAFDTIEARFKEIRAKHGPEAVLFCQGTGRDIGGPISFLAYNFGSPNWTQLGLSGQSCYTPRLAAMKATMGDFAVLDCSQFLEKRYDDAEYKVPKVIVVWGQNPPPTCPDGFFGHWILDCRRRGSQLIVIDPRITWIASRAKYHLQLRPGTDGALALGMLNVIINEGIYDKEFVDKWTFGFDKLKERVQQYPPNKVARITWVPENTIVEAARLYATSKPAGIHWGVAIDMCPQGTSVAQAVSHLWTITGNIDVPGSNVIARPSHGITTYPYTTEDLSTLYGEDLVLKLREKRIGAGKYPMVAEFRSWAHPDTVIEQVLSEDPYPLKAAWIQTTNILGGQAADTRKHYEALQKLDFIVVVDLFHNPTTMALADIVLPAATFAEKNSVRAWWAPLNIIQKVVQVGECKSDWEINFEMAKRLNPKGLKWNSVIDLINDRLSPIDKTFQEMVEKGCWEMPPEGHHSRPYRRHERGLLRQDQKPGFNTATGKVELWSKYFEKWGLDPLPYYDEPPQSPIRTPGLYLEYPLSMISGARSPVYFHAEHSMIPWLREKDPFPNVEIHPETARKHGIEDGEWVYIENRQGRIKRKAKVTPTVHPKMITVPHGWWLPELKGSEPDLYGLWEYQVNQLVSSGQHSTSGFGGGQYKTTLVRIAKIIEEEN